LSESDRFKPRSRATRSPKRSGRVRRNPISETLAPGHSQNTMSRQGYGSHRG